MSVVYSDSLQGPERERYARKLLSLHGLVLNAECLETALPRLDPYRIPAEEPCSNFGFRTWKIQECPNNYVEWLICDTSVLYSYRSLSQILVNYCSTFLKSEFFYDNQLLPLWNEWILEPRSVKVTLLQHLTHSAHSICMQEHALKWLEGCEISVKPMKTIGGVINILSFPLWNLPAIS